MGNDKQFVLDLIEELIAVNRLEYYNKNWLAGSEKYRYENIYETLLTLQRTIEILEVSNKEN